MNSTDIDNLHRSITNLITKLLKTNGNNFHKPCLDLIDELVNIGSYTPQKWSWGVVKTWEEKLQEIGKLAHGQEILGLFKEKRLQATEPEKEPLSFAINELLWGVFSDNKKTESQLNNMVKKYPDNMLFAFYYCTFVFGDEEIQNHEIVLISDELIDTYKKTLTFMSSQPVSIDEQGVILGLGINIFYRYIEHHDYESALNVRELLSAQTCYVKNPHFQNIIYSLKHAVVQSKAYFKLNEQTAKTFKQELQSISKDSSKKSFEQLIIFTAIITFVVTAAGSAIKSPLPLWEITGLGMTLLVFVLAIMMCLDKPQKIYKDLRFYILIIAFGFTATLATFNTRNTCLWICTVNIQMPNTIFKTPEHPLPPLLLNEN
ncbi:hypothetical protein SKP08_001951 [Vibrio fluvialis]|nr:hypothetical protein [Vibrio fluvialis]